MCSRAPRLRLVGKTRRIEDSAVRGDVKSLGQAYNGSHWVSGSVKEIDGMFDCGEIEMARLSERAFFGGTSRDSERVLQLMFGREGANGRNGVWIDC